MQKERKYIARINQTLCKHQIKFNFFLGVFYEKIKLKFLLNNFKKKNYNMIAKLFI